MTDEARFIENNRKIIKQHNKISGGHFMYHVPDGRLFYEDNIYGAYFIPNEIITIELVNILTEDIAKKVNTIPERFMKNKIIYHEDCDY